MVSMKENKKKNRRFFKQLSLWVPVVLLAIFAYLNLRELNSREEVVADIQPIQMVQTVSPMPWEEPQVPVEVAENVYYGSTEDLNRPIIMSESGKEYLAITVKDSGEEMVDLSTISNDRIKHISEIAPEYKDRYPNSVKVRKGVYEALVKMLETLPGDVGIAYSEGFRTLTKQKEHFDSKFNEIHETNKDARAAYKETCKQVEPFIDNLPIYCSGAVINMTLFKTEDGKHSLIDMGKFGLTDGMNEQQETFSFRATTDQRKNRIMLLNAAVKAGFVNYGMEWWHYSIGDKMHAYVKDEPHARYGSVLDDSEKEIVKLTVGEYLQQMTKSEARPSETPTVPRGVIPITSFSELNKLLRETSGLVLIKFFATWCGPCNRIAPEFVEIAQENPLLTCIEIDVDKVPDAAAKYNVTVKPTFVFIKGEKAILTIVGSDVGKVKNAIAELTKVMHDDSDDEKSDIESPLDSSGSDSDDSAEDGEGGPSGQEDDYVLVEESAEVD